MRPWRTLLLLACTLPAAALAGCQREEPVERYTVTHADRESFRLLAALVPHGDKVWVAKLSGPQAAVAGEKEHFDQFLDSLRFDDKKDPPLTWTVPKDWQHQPGRGMRAATFRIDAPPGLEVTLFAFGKDESGSVLANVNRWRRQLNLPPLEAADLDQNVTRARIGDEPATRVDLVGLGTHTVSRPNPHAGEHAPVGLPDFTPQAKAGRGGPLPFTYDLPAGWKKSEKGMAMSAETFVAGAGEDTAVVTMTPLGGAGGGLGMNINRWRKQVGLPPVEDAEAARSAAELQVAGQPAKYVDIDNPAGKDRISRILGVVVPAGDRTWFIKMSGPHDVVGQQKTAFESFAKSLKFAAK